MKRLYSIMLLMVTATIGIVAGASELAPFVTGIALYGSPNDWNEPLGEFAKDANGVWRLDNVEIDPGTEFRLKLHVNDPEAQESDMWFGCPPRCRTDTEECRLRNPCAVSEFDRRG